MRYLNLHQFFKKSLSSDRELHAVERRMAKEWIKKRLAAIYPELQGDPAALEQTYRELGLESTGTVQRAEGEVKSFNMNLPPSVGDGFEQR